MLTEHPQDRLTLTDFSSFLRDRVWGGLLLTFAAVNLLPLPPGSTTLTSIPLLIVTAQMALGRAVPWFPQRAERRGISKKEVSLLLAKLLPWERKMERVFRPRMPVMTNHRAVRMIGVTSFLLSVIVCLPIPLGNHAPALTMTFFALALLYRDGVLVICGFAATIVSLALVSVTIGAAWLAMVFSWQHLMMS